MGMSPDKDRHVKANPAIPAAESSLISRFGPVMFPLFLTVLTVVAYAKVFSCGFIEAYDDEEFVTHNFVVLKGLTQYGLKWSLTSFMTGNWHPLTWWSHMADVTFFGLNPAGHHATNLLLHVLNTLLLYGLLVRTTACRGRSFMVAALFALHPLHVESVAWVSERKDLLSTAFGLAALHLYHRYLQVRTLPLYLAMTALFCLSLMSKPMLVTLPFLLLMLDYWPLERFRDQSLQSLMREKIPLLLPALAISLLTIAAQRSVGAISVRPLLSRTYSALDSYLVYLKKLFIPYDLAAFYPYTPVSASRAVAAALVLAAVSAYVWRYRRRCPWSVTGWLWFLGLLVPVIGIISVGTQAYADRYTYLPAVGIFIMAVWGIDEYLDKAGFSGRLTSAVAVAVLFVCICATWVQVGYWKDGFTLYGRDLAVVKGNWHAHLNLGTMLVERKRYDEGIAHYHEALLNTPPSEANIYHNLAVAYERKGDPALGRHYYRLTVQLAPARDRGYLGLARIADRAGDIDGALDSIREGLQNVPDNGILLAKKAYLLHKSGRLEEAVSTYRQAIAKEPDLVQNYVNLGALLAQQGKDGELAAIVGQLRRIDAREADALRQGGGMRDQQ